MESQKPDIRTLQPGMLCHTTKGTGYIVEVDLHNELILLQREDESLPFQVHLDDIQSS